MKAGPPMRFVVAFGIILLSAVCAASPKTLAGTVTDVPDGDVIAVDGQLVRLYGVDCPEKGQPWGREARDLVSELALGKTVTVVWSKQDRRRRLVGLVTLPDGDCLNDILLERGAAWWDFRHAPNCETCAILESLAEQAKAGLWASGQPPVPPWDWRKHPREGCGGKRD